MHVAVRFSANISLRPYPFDSEYTRLRRTGVRPTDRIFYLVCRSSIDVCKECQKASNRLILIRSHAVGKVEYGFASARGRQRLSAPANITCIYRKNSGDRLKQGCLAGAVRTDGTDGFTCKDVKADIREHHLVDILLGDRINAQDLTLCFTG